MRDNGERVHPVVVARNLDKRIGEKWVLRQVSLELGVGSALAILGPNGSGKTTLLRVLAGLWSPNAGELYRFGGRLKEARSDPRVGYLGHASFLYPSLSGLENLAFYARLWRLDRPRDRAAAALKQVGLTWAMEEPVKSYSRGMTQRAAIARTFLTDPQLVLMDEPYTGLDVSGQALLDGLLADLRQRGGASICITHQVREVFQSSDAVAIIVGGRIVWWDRVASWTPQTLTTHYQDWIEGRGHGHS